MSRLVFLSFTHLSDTGADAATVSDGQHEFVPLYLLQGLGRGENEIYNKADMWAKYNVKTITLHPCCEE